MLVLYHGANSVCSVKVRIVLAEKGLKWEGRHIDLPKGEHLRPEYLEINPRAVVPVLEHNGALIRESTVICEYLNRLNDSPQLVPSTFLEQARMRVWGINTLEYHDSVNTLTFSSYQRSMLLAKPAEELAARWEAMPDKIDRIRSVHLAADTIFKPMTSRDTKSVLSKVGVVHKNYWLAVGTLEPRKNLLVLLEAFAALPASIRKARPLVIVGSVGWKANALLSKIERMKRTGEIIHLGYLERSALAVLFAGASALVFTSIYEGFGLPLIEAMQSGTAVLASDISCLPEVAKGGALYFDPHSPDDLTRLLQRFFEDKTLNTQMTLRSLERSKHFSWQKSAKETADVYRAVLKPDQTNLFCINELGS